MIVAWSLLYIFTIITGNTYVWSSCRNEYNTIYCSSSLEDRRCTDEFLRAGQNITAFFFNKTCFATNDTLMRSRQNETFAYLPPISASEEFFERYILEKSPTLDLDFGGGLNHKLVISYAIAWLLTALALCKGVNVIGRISYLTATLPYLFCFFLFIRAVTLDGAIIGMNFYLLKPDFSIVFDPSVWRAAATHVSYSLSIGFGGMISFASYIPRQHNSYKDAAIITIADAFMSILGGTAVFSVLGFLSAQLSIPISQVVQSGTSLAFVAYPEALSRMPLSWLWALLFFAMIWILGLSTQFGYGEIMIGALSEQFPGLLKHKTYTTFGICTFLYMCGLILCTRSGIFFFNILNDYSSSFSLEFVIFLEAIIICFIYGYNNYLLDLESMMGKAKNKISRIFGPTGWYIGFVWKYIAPFIASVIFVFSLLTQINTDLTYGKGDRKYILPGWTIGLGWIISIIPLFCLPFFAVYNFLKFRKRNLSWRELFVLQPKWPSYGRQKPKRHIVAPKSDSPTELSFAKL